MIQLNRSKLARTLVRLPPLAIYFIATALGSLAFAGGDASDGHSHGPAPAAISGPALPRFTAQSDLFEAVGVLSGNELSITIDRYASNEPVLAAKLEMESGSFKAVLDFHADHGDYSAPAAPFKNPGTYPITLTIIAGEQSDLLAGELVVPDPKASADVRYSHAPWWRWLTYAAALAALLAVAVRFLRRRTTGPEAMLAITVSVFLVSATATFDARAGGDASDGHAHDAPTASTGANAPQRLPSGDVFLPKRSQRQLGVRTVLAASASLPQTLELNARVVVDPNASGRVQPTLAGRLEAGPRGLPQLGQTVRRGEVLALVRASANPIERANQVALTSELQSSLALAQQRAARLAQLEGTVAQKDIDAAQAEAASLRQRLQAVQAGVAALEPLLAPVSGVIAVRHAALGQVVEARELLFEIVDPTRLMLEASAFDAGLPGTIASASMALPAVGGALGAADAAGGAALRSLPLQFVGAGRSLREGAIPLLFRVAPGTHSKGIGAAALPLAVHQNVRLQVQTKTQVQGFALPAAAIVKTPSNQDAVWVHSEAEVFAPRPVRLVALDGARVAVLDGLKAGERVVTQGAALLSQVR